MIEEAILEGRRLAHENRLEGKDLDELDELEDEEDEDFLESYRQKRVAEMQAITQKSKHRAVYPLSKPDYSSEVTEASKDGFVLVNLTSGLGTNVESRILSELWRTAAAEYGELKFCQIRGDQAIEGYPDRNCPTILIYNKGDIVEQIVTLIAVGGVRMNMKNLDSILISVGAVKENDLRVQKRRKENVEEDDKPKFHGIRGSSKPTSADDDEDDWD